MITASPAFLQHWLPDGVTRQGMAAAPGLTYSDLDTLQQDWLRRECGPGIVFPTHRIASSQGFVDAALGGELDIPTLDGRVKLKIPEGTQTGKQFRIRGKGVAPVRGGGAGDLMCRVVVETPVNLGRRQRELLEEFRSSLEGDDSHSPKTTGFFDGVKRFFGDL